MEKIEVDKEALENARYQEILDSNKYVELKVLIGDEDTEINGRVGNVPCVKFTAQNASSKQVGFLYTVLQSYLEHLIHTYPEECLLAQITNDTKILGHIETDEEKK